MLPGFTPHLIGQVESCPRAGGIAVAVPARNEARRLPALFAALAGQVAAPPFTLFLLLDACEDDSAAIVARLAPTLPYPVHFRCCPGEAEPNAGRARRRAAEFALEHVAEGVLLTTDADSRPEPGWIAANLGGLAQADLVAGRIVRRAGSSALQDRVERYMDGLHRLRRILDPVAWENGHSHHWTSGTSLAMRTATYRALDGFPEVPHGEDALLVDHAARHGWRVRRDAGVVVRTSTRRHGRVRHGFAAALAALDQPDAMPVLAHPEDEAWRYRHHALARHLYERADVRALAVALALAEAEVAQVAGEARNAEAFATRIVGAPPAGMRALPLPLAEVALAAIATSLPGAA